MDCNYCGKPARQVTGKKIYPHLEALHALIFLECAPCGAYVGCHKGTDKPLGLLADPPTRRARQKAHAAFDSIWKTGKLPRKKAYSWLADALKIKVDDCHIGRFNPSQCGQVVAAVKVLNQQKAGSDG